MAIMPEQETPQVDTQEQSAPGLTLQDLIAFAQIIQITSQRGSFRAEELANVGNLYNKLVAFLEFSGAITRPDAEQGEQQEENQNA